MFKEITWRSLYPSSANTMRLDRRQLTVSGRQARGDGPRHVSSFWLSWQSGDHLKDARRQWTNGLDPLENVLIAIARSTTKFMACDAIRWLGSCQCFADRFSLNDKRAIVRLEHLNGGMRQLAWRHKREGRAEVTVCCRALQGRIDVRRQLFLLVHKIELRWFIAMSSSRHLSVDKSVGRVFHGASGAGARIPSFARTPHDNVYFLRTASMSCVNNRRRFWRVRKTQIAVG